ncbi:MAG TPA: 16S rRNA (guanine(966)-N(2))-methyltransferase RsmD [Chloroflexi bacterium]|nr:16S rRNA (guanine(966)-N(2))-methyltransferase RsmD [Chloroflexota bacterium]HHW85985.1 16S rRNA (guanine(966)-N(2))-methyltransferase RsmD [Chloroflexota bacterium]
MRVITGKAKGRKLMMVPGGGTRPITDRAKEALFSIMGNWIEETRVLDLFGGTGGVGIESLSRGAAWVDFVDLSHQAVETIRANLRHCGFERQASVTRLDSFAYLQRYHGVPYDLIYVAPPQYQGMWLKALTLIDGKPELLAQNGSVIVQIHPREETPVTLTRLVEYDRRRYGSVLLLFYATAEDLAEMDDDVGDEAEDGIDFAADDLVEEENAA